MEQVIYTGFIKRVISGLLDYLFFILFTLIIFFVGYFTQITAKNYLLTINVLNILFQFIYNITMPQYFGGTLGKILFKIKIKKVNFDKIGFKEAFLRYLVQLTWYIFHAVMNMIIIISTSDIIFNEFETFSDLNNYIDSFIPQPITIIGLIIVSIWIYSEYIVLLLNKKKRGFQDFLAGTVVINIRGKHKSG